MIQKWFFGLLALTFLAGCSDVNDRRQLSVYICDAQATDYEEVTVHLSAVEIRESGTDEWMGMPLEQTELNLLELVNGSMQQVALSVMADGKRFDAVRLTFDTENAVVISGGRQYPADMDASAAVVTIPINELVVDGPNKPLLFDFNVPASVAEQDTLAVERLYRITPVVSFVDLDRVGVVQGGLQAGENIAMSKQALIRFTNKETNEEFNTYSTIASALRGAFFMRLPAGDYTMQVLPSDDMGLLPLDKELTVVSRQVTDFGTIILTVKTTEQE